MKVKLDVHFFFLEAWKLKCKGASCIIFFYKYKGNIILKC